MDKDRIVGSANNIFGQAENVAGKVAGDTRTEAEGLAREGKGTFQNAFGQAKDAARDIGRSASKAVGTALDTGSSMARSGGDAVAENVQGHPGSALLAAGVIGFALGLIIAKGSQPRRRRVWDRYY